MPKLFQTVPQFFLGDRTSSDVITRAKDITALDGMMGSLKSAKAQLNDPFRWQQPDDSFILAKLLRRHGFNSYYEILSDAAWINNRPQNALIKDLAKRREDKPREDALTLIAIY